MDNAPVSYQRSRPPNPYRPRTLACERFELARVDEAHAIGRGRNEGSELLLHFAHFRAEDVLAVLEHALDARVDVFLQRAVLGFEVGEFPGQIFCVFGWCSIPSVVSIGGVMTSPKAEVRSMIEGLPEDASLEDIQYHLYVLEKVKRGLARAETEGPISTEEVKARLSKWLAG